MKRYLVRQSDEMSIVVEAGSPEDAKAVAQYAPLEEWSHARSEFEVEEAE